MNEGSGQLISIRSLKGGYVNLSNIVFNHNQYCELIRFDCFGMFIKSQSCMMETLLTDIFINATQSLYYDNDLIFVGNTIILHLSRSVLISNNEARNIIITHSGIVTFSDNITFFNNSGLSIIHLESPLSYYVKVMEHSTITFESNNCFRTLLTVETVNTLYPYCVFQYFASESKIDFQNQLLQLYSIQFISNSQALYTLNYYISHCRWLESSVFNRYDPGVINSHIMYSNDSVINHHHLCYCPQNETHYCTTDILGCVHPGQTLQTHF